MIVVTFVDAIDEIRCGSVDIRNHPRVANQPKDTTTQIESKKYRNCTVMEGDFSLSMITSLNVTEDEFPVFENLREITGYLLVFQVR